LQRLEAIKDEQRAPRADELGQPPAFVERARRALRQAFVAEEGEGLGQKQVGGNGGLLARALAVEGPRKDGVAAGPVLRREVGGPLRDERGLPLAAEGDEGEDVGAGVLPIADCRLPIADCRLPIADCRLPIADCRLPIANCRSKRRGGA
jgi:hypothetical protein